MTRGKVEAAMGLFAGGPFVVKVKGKHKRIVGPFWTQALASAWAVVNAPGESWRIVELTPIEAP